MKTKNTIPVGIALMMLGVTLMSTTAQAALNLEGQSGVFLNTLAYPLSPNKVEVSSHNVNLDSAGDVSTYNFAYGIGHNLEFGYTKITSSVTGVKDQNVIFAKQLLSPETKTAPALSAWVLNRELSEAGSTIDYGISVTKLVNLGKHPTVIDLGLRSTKALGLGLFGIGNDRALKLEGSVAVFITKNFAVGTEFKQQIGADTWKDIAFRYKASDKLNLDVGIADLGPGLSNQLALAATWSK